MDPGTESWGGGSDNWDENEELSIIQTLSDTNLEKSCNPCLVTPDDLSDVNFKLREVEKRVLSRIFPLSELEILLTT